MNYEIRELTREEFLPLWETHAREIFDDKSQIFRFYDHLSEEEKAKANLLQAYLGEQYQLRLGLYVESQFAGWAIGHQESSETYYMRNSAILPEYRKQGLYSALLRETIARVEAKGFQKIYSRHTASNNAVIIPKLKIGFTISALEVTDIFGVLVHLTYLPKELRKKMMNYRIGDLKPDQEIRNCLKI